MARAGPRREEQQHARSVLAAQRVPLAGSNRMNVPGPPLTVPPPHSTSTSPSITVSQAFSFTWCSPSSWPGWSTISTARAPSSEWRTIGSRVPFGAAGARKVPALHDRSVYAYTQPLFMPLVVDSFVMGPFQSNCYVVRAERGAAEAAVIDPGDDPTPLRLELAGLGARTAGILVTHADVDHIGGVAALAEGTGAEVWAPSGRGRGAEERSRRAAGMRVPPYDPEHAVTGGDEVVGRGNHVRRSSTCPGTAPATSRSTPTGISSPATCCSPARSVASTSRAATGRRCSRPFARCSTASRATRSCIPGHGPATTLERELQTNPFLRDLRAESH